MQIMREGECSKGFGFVCYKSTRAASCAASNMNKVLCASKRLQVILMRDKDHLKSLLEEEDSKYELGVCVPGVSCKVNDVTLDLKSGSPQMELHQGHVCQFKHLAKCCG